MPQQHINYGTKKIIYSRKRDKNSQLYILIEDHEIKQDENCMENSRTQVTTDKCFCPDCRKTFNIPKMDIQTNRFSKKINKSVNIHKEFKDYLKETNIMCPDCGASGKYAFIEKQTKSDEPLATDDVNHINYDGAWLIPGILQGRYVFEFIDASGKSTRIDDNLMFEHTVIFPSGKQYTWETEMSQEIDMVRGRILSYETRIDGKNRTPNGPGQDVINPFQYRDTASLFSAEARLNVMSRKNIVTGTFAGQNSKEVISFKDGIFAHAFCDMNSTPIYDINDDVSQWSATSFLYAGLTPEQINQLYTESAITKSHAIMRRFEKTIPNPIYADLKNNGLNLKRHERGSTEENTEIDNSKMDLFMYMCARYPAAVEYAVSRAELRAVNYEFSEKRKAGETEGYVAKTATNGARAKFFREEMNYVSEQLIACDDKILNEIRTSVPDEPCYVMQKDENGKYSIQKQDHYPETENGTPSNLEIMRDKLSFFIYGFREGHPVPSDIAVRFKNSQIEKESNPPIKKIKSMFAAEPIATASNIYTMQKWKIKDPNHVKVLINLINEQSPVVNPPEIRSNGRRIHPERKYCTFVNAGILAPLRDKTALRFAKLYASTHDTLPLIDEIFDNRKNSRYSEKWVQFSEDIKLYDALMSNSHVDLIKTKADIVARVEDGSSLEEKKTQLRNYLDNNGADSIKNAYRDFATIYGENTEEMINMLAREIKKDKQMDEIKHYSEKYGMTETLEKYKDYLTIYEDPKQAITDHQYFSDRTLVLTTRNNKPLFERSIAEIHDELSEMSKKSVTKNEYLTLSEKDLALNGEITVDLSELPKSQWIKNPPEFEPGTMGKFKFHVLDNRFDFVRVATDLRNCVASAGYFNDTKAGSKLIASMSDENNRVCACIELDKRENYENGTHYRVSQLQGYRDGALDARFGPAFYEWCEKNNIDAESDPDGNIHAIGEKKYFYGDGHADYHNEELDPVFNTTISNEKAARIRAERVQKAISIYGGSDISGPILPEVPDDLRDMCE